MTDPRNREHNRAVRAYQRAHPGTTLGQARRAVADRAGRQPGLPDRIPGAPLPRPAERLDAYVKRVAAAAGVQQHRAMELLGLEPGTSATDRLNNLAAGLPDHTVQALTAATGMTADQARALTAPLTARPDLEAVRRITEANIAAGHHRRGGEGKTSTRELSAAVALALAHRAGMIDADTAIADDRTVQALSAPAAGPIPALFREQPWQLVDSRPPHGKTPTSLLDAVTLAARTAGLRVDAERGGAGKTSTDVPGLARHLAAAYGSRVLPVDLPVHELLRPSYRPAIVDLDWPSDALWSPVGPEVADEVAEAPGTGQDTVADVPRPE
ncbi:hypothetical protein ACIQVO_38220 [Streptomyces sp. NPDC101062]|uniref:hypothetical protein n=1 Tax=unclassified Streptomyces TaxID=2593676 RepID=UPI003820F4A6